MRRDPAFAIAAFIVSLTSVALVTTGEVSPVGLAIPAIALVSVLRPGLMPARGRALDLAFNVVAVLFFVYFVACMAGLRVLAGAVALTFPAAAHALMERGLVPHQTLRRLHLLGFFQLVALAASTTNVLFLPVLAAHLLLTPVGLTLAALERAQGQPRRPMAVPRRLAGAGALASALCVAGGTLVFLALPRYEAGLMHSLSGPSQRLSGFSESVKLGDISSIKLSDAIVMRVHLRGARPESVRWRGIALDRFTGREWSATPKMEPVRGRGPFRIGRSVEGGARVVEEFTLEPLRALALFNLPRATVLVPGSFDAIREDASGNLMRSTDSGRRVRYEVVSELGPDATPLDDDERSRYLQLPELDPRLPELARRMAGDGSEAERAARIEHGLQEGYPYSLDVNDQGVKDPVSRFLLERTPAHCEYFATGMAVLLRLQGIPARVVNGFQEGTWSSFFRTFVVRRRDAHSWVEAFIPGAGWMTFDPTPFAGRPEAVDGADALEFWRRAEMMWDDNVIGFNYTFQLGLLATIREAFDAIPAKARALHPGRAVLVAGAVALASCGALAWRSARVRRRRGVTVAYYARALRTLARLGWKRADGETPQELARRVEAEAPATGSAATEITRLYYDERYGGRPADAARVDALMRALRTAPRRSTKARSGPPAPPPPGHAP